MYLLILTLTSICVSLISNIPFVLTRKIRTEETTTLTTVLRTAVTAAVEEFKNKKSVLFLCRDNYIRSPMLKSMFMHLLETTNQTHNWIVDSAGIGWWDTGKGMDPRAEEWLRAYHYNTSHVARELCDDDFFKFQYIISTDENDFTFSEMEKPENATAQLLLLGSFNHIQKYPGKNYLEDPFFKKSKLLNIAMGDIIDKGYWYLVGFLDTHGVYVPSTCTKPKPSTLSSKKKKGTTKKWSFVAKTGKVNPRFTARVTQTQTSMKYANYV